jgi:hypothetical protein
MCAPYSAFRKTHVLVKNNKCILAKMFSLIVLFITRTCFITLVIIFRVSYNKKTRNALVFT